MPRCEDLRGSTMNFVVPLMCLVGCADPEALIDDPDGPPVIYFARKEYDLGCISPEHLRQQVISFDLRIADVPRCRLTRWTVRADALS